MTMRYRPHGTADYLDIARLRWLLKSKDTGEIAGCDRAAFVEAYGRHLAEEDARGDTIHWLAESESAAVAVMTVRCVRKEPSPGSEADHWGYLTNCYVETGHRNRGIGTALLEQVVRWARERKLELLIVWPSDRSFPFY